MQADSLQFNTRRTTNGATSRAALQDTSLIARFQLFLYNETADTPHYDLSKFTKLNVDSLWKLADLKTPGYIDSLRKVVQARHDAWRRRLDSLPSQDELAQIQRQADSIRIDSANGAQILDALRRSRALYKRVDSLQNVMQTTARDFKAEISYLESFDTLVSSSIVRDYERIRGLAQIPALSGDGITRAIFGRSVVNHFQSMLTTMRVARGYNAKFQTLKQPKEPRRPRLAGQNIAFSDRRNWPSLWIQDAALTARLLRQFSMSGAAQNIANNQRLIGLPTKLALGGTYAGGVEATLKALLDYLGALPSENFSILASHLPLQGIQLSTSALLPDSILGGVADITAGLNSRGPELGARLAFSGHQLRFASGPHSTNVDERFVQIRDAALELIKDLTLDAQASMSGTVFNFSMSSNLGDIIAQALQDAVKAQIDAQAPMIQERIRNEVSGERKDLDTEVTESTQDVASRLHLIDNRVNSLWSQIAKQR
jgi:uncharacterized protein (TIGR03545 family)